MALGPLIVDAPAAEGAELLLDPAAAPRLARTEPRREVLLVLGDPVEHLLGELARRRERPRPDGRPIHLADVVQRCRLGSQLRVLHAVLGPDRVQVEQRPGDGALALDPWPELVDWLGALLDPELELLRALAPEIDLARWPGTAHLREDRAMLRPA